MIVVTTPTGKICHRVLKQLLAEEVPMRIIARDPAKLPGSARDRADIIQGSHGDPQVMTFALKGADTLFWVAPPDYQAASVEAAYPGFVRPAVEAIRHQGVKRVVGISLLGRNTSCLAHSGFAAASLAMNDLIADTDVAFRSLTLPTFMDNLLGQAQVIKEQGRFFDVVSPDRKMPTVAARDIAAAATRLLLDESWSGQKEVPLLGPEDLSHDDKAAIISEVLGKPVEYQQIPGPAFKDQLLTAGLSEPMAQALLEMMLAKDEGLDNGIPRGPRHAHDAPTTFRQWCEDELKPVVSAQAV